MSDCTVELDQYRCDEVKFYAMAMNISRREFVKRAVDLYIAYLRGDIKIIHMPPVV